MFARIALLLTLWLPAGTSSSSGQLAGLGTTGDAFSPDTVLYLESGLRIIRLRTPGSEVVALRLAVPLPELPSDAGVGRMLQLLGEQRARAAAAPVGVDLEGARTPWGVAYTVVRARADFDFLAYLIRRAAAQPSPQRVVLERHRSALKEEISKGMETPSGRILTELRATAAPSSLPPEGTLTSLNAISPATLRDFWRRTHRLEAMTLVIAGDLPDELVVSAFERFATETEPGVGVAPRRAPAPAPRRTQVLRHWYGEAYQAGDTGEPRGPVGAVLLSTHLREAGADLEAEVQLWELDRSQIIVVVGAAYPASAARMRQRIQGLVSEARDGTTPTSVRDAVERVRRSLLYDARTPRGLVTFVGRHTEATGGPTSGRRFLDALEAVTAASMRAYFDALLIRAPALAQVRP